MPGYGVGSATHRILLADYDGSDNWVDIRAGRSSGAASRVQFAGMRITGVTATGTPILDVREDPLVLMRRQLFVESIVGWSLRADEADEAPMPLTPDVFVEVLDGDVGEWLDGQITSYYARRRLGDDAQGESTGSSSRRSRDGVRSQA